MFDEVIYKKQFVQSLLRRTFIVAIAGLALCGVGFLFLGLSSTGFAILLGATVFSAVTQFFVMLPNAVNSVRVLRRLDPSSALIRMRCLSDGPVSILGTKQRMELVVSDRPNIRYVSFYRIGNSVPRSTIKGADLYFLRLSDDCDSYFPITRELCNSVCPFDGYVGFDNALTHNYRETYFHPSRTWIREFNISGKPITLEGQDNG